MTNDPNFPGRVHTCYSILPVAFDSLDQELFHRSNALSIYEISISDRSKIKFNYINREIIIKVKALTVFWILLYINLTTLAMSYHMCGLSRDKGHAKTLNYAVR